VPTINKSTKNSLVNFNIKSGKQNGNRKNKANFHPPSAAFDEHNRCEIII